MVRRITNGGKKVIGKFPSLKMNRAVWWESQLERDYIYYLEIDRDVISYKEQPLKVRYVYDREIHLYTPDFLVVKPDKKQVVEVKDEESANKEEYKLLFKLVAPILFKEGYEFVLVTDKEIRVDPVLSNIKLLNKYSRTVISSKHQIDAYALFSVVAESTIGELARFFSSKGASVQTVYALIYWGILWVDLSKPINSQSKVRLSTAASLSKEK